MIGHLTGKISAINATSIIMDVNGVGYEISCPQTTLAKLALLETVSLFIHTHVREDQITLLGFVEQQDRDLFRMLISVSGVGPKMALNLLSHQSSHSLKNAIATAQTNIFTQTPGIGKKVAQKIIVDLKSKLGSLAELDLNDSNQNVELISALQALGYKTQELMPLIQQLPTELTTLESQIKYILKRS